MSIGLVIVTYNSAGVLENCLASISNGHEIVVVDNASKDNSVALAQARGAHVIANDKNVGFGAACNQGAKALSTTYAFFVNPDAVLAPAAIDEIEKAISKFPDAGGFAPAVWIRGEAATFRTQSLLEEQGRRFMSNDLAPTDYAEIGFMDGAAFVCSLESFWRIGGFDEDLFLYFEDDDLSFRMKQNGVKMIYVPFSVVTHLKKMSSGNSYKLKCFRAWHETASRLKVCRKHGLPFELKREKRRALIRLIRSSLLFQFAKAMRYYGVWRALRDASSA
jgi:N-acetylglucosaminyl-diphospho-decaprenol L-rhamnosyltransferase